MLFQAKTNLMFHKSQNKEYLNLCIERALKNELDWVNQFLDILGDKVGTINDIGCNVGQFYKALNNKNKADYIGYDIEPIYIEKAKGLFPDGKFMVLDINTELPRSADISISSATIEHCGPSALDNILSTTRKHAIIRTMLGIKHEEGYHQKKGADPYIVKQFSFEEIFTTFTRNGFIVKLETDRHTKSLPYYIQNEERPDMGIIRTQYLIIGEKKKI